MVDRVGRLGGMDRRAHSGLREKAPPACTGALSRGECRADASVRTLGFRECKKGAFWDEGAHRADVALEVGATHWPVRIEGVEVPAGGATAVRLDFEARPTRAMRSSQAKPACASAVPCTPHAQMSSAACCLLSAVPLHAFRQMLHCARRLSHRTAIVAGWRGVAWRGVAWRTSAGPESAAGAQHRRSRQLPCHTCGAGAPQR
jgi:hypothetical protein